jgi:hypothetical protein
MVYVEECKKSVQALKYEWWVLEAEELCPELAFHNLLSSETCTLLCSKFYYPDIHQNQCFLFFIFVKLNMRIWIGNFKITQQIAFLLC